MVAPNDCMWEDSRRGSKDCSKVFYFCFNCQKGVPSVEMGKAKTEEQLGHFNISEARDNRTTSRAGGIQVKKEYPGK